MRKISIPVDDHGTECNLGYIVEYKVSGDAEYTRQTPDALTTPIEITNLLDNTEYDVKITRICCNGSNAEPTIITVDTTIV